MSPGKQGVLSAAPPSKRGLDTAGLFARALELHRLGRLAEARAGYAQVLKKRPNHFDALQLLGLCEHASGNTEAGVRLLRRALLLDPRSAAVHSHLGALLIALKRLDEALALCDSAIALNPDFVAAHYNRGVTLIAMRRFAEAVISFDTVIAIDPRHVDALNNRGNALHELGRFGEAIESYNSALALQPAHVLAILNRGAAFKELKQTDRAIADFDLALALAPDHCGAWINRGETLCLQRRGDEALASFDKALAISPALSEAWLGRANVLMTLMTGRVSEALADCQRALSIKPDSVSALTLLGQWHAQQGDADAALSCLDQALAIKPDDEAALSNRIYTLDFSEAGGFAQHQAARSEWWRQIGSRIAAQHAPQHDNDRNPTRRLVVGYVSGEFMRRSAAFTFRPVLEKHDRAQFEVVCYSGSVKEDAVTDSFRNLADRWRSIWQWSDDRLIDCIRADKIDILVDLSGHGDGNRLRAFARKPAPVQVTAWGHCTGTGQPTIDYLFSDPVLIPADVRHLFAEQIYDLPCAIMLEPPPIEFRCCEPPVTSNGYVTYGVFNRISKISNTAVGVWAQILRSDPTARLLIKNQLVDDIAIQRMLLEKFASHGIAPDQIRLLGSTSREQHLAAYRQVDICLDPFPQGGGVSTWEALYMGVPVVTMLGDAIPRRLGAAIMSAIGMTDWVAMNHERYIEIALRSTAESLRRVRTELPGLIDRHCSPAAYTKAVEDAYRTMWRKRCDTIQM